MSTVIIERMENGPDTWEHRVPAPDGREAGAYYTDDRDDAEATAQAMHGQGIKLKVRTVEYWTHPDA
jgi:hypothetical protein